MALGDQSKALRIISIARGWDPTVIPAITSPEGKQYPAVNIANFDKAPDRPGSGDHCVGQLPEGIPETFPQATDPVYGENVTFDVPDAGRENANRRSSGSNPYAGKGGM